MQGKIKFKRKRMEVFSRRPVYIVRTYHIPGPWWAGHVLKGDTEILCGRDFDPNILQDGENALPLEYFIRTENIRGVDALLEMGAKVTPDLLAYGNEKCQHTEDERLDYEGDCCIILEMLQHAHNLPPRLCATAWSFAQMSGAWLDLVLQVVQERLSKESSD